MNGAALKKNEAETCPATADVIELLTRTFPPGSGFPSDPMTLADLKELTARLIECYRREGRLEEDPFFNTVGRRIHCYADEIRKLLQGRTVLVTGGAGCVGQGLLSALAKFEPKKIVCVDRAEAEMPGAACYRQDIRNWAALEQVFARERPAVVFHLAAQRNPGLAERQVYETLTTNVFGTANVIRACEQFKVERCVFSSTGKASRYLTHEIYAASKKLAEWQFAIANRSGSTKYAAARFTHVLNNSLVCEQLDGWIAARRPVGVHAPGRLIVAQNAAEAVQLLLNSLLYAERGKLGLVVVRNLGWPVETLELALYRIVRAGDGLPIYFIGTPRGYTEDFFRGQIDWRLQCDVHPLLNALESAHRSHDEAGDMIHTKIEAFDEGVVQKHLQQLQEAVQWEQTPESDMREALSRACDDICSSVFEAAPPEEILNILHWGVGPKSAGARPEGALPEVVRFLARAVEHRLNPDVTGKSVLKREEYDELVATLQAGGCLEFARPRNFSPSFSELSY